MTKHRYAIDIGSTVIKLAKIDVANAILDQTFFPRDHEAGIAAQVNAILADESDYDDVPILACSSANGGLRVGILCLSERFSGTALRNQVLLAGANPVYVIEMSPDAHSSSPVDILLIGGGIDDDDCEPLAKRVAEIDYSAFKFDALMYAGNKHMVARIKKAVPQVHVVENPLAGGLRSECDSAFEAIRDAYLRDLVHKEGISDLPERITCGIRPTPEVVNRGFQRVISNRSTIAVPGASVVVDIGGATTDMHYTIEIVRENSLDKPNRAVSVARYVFADLGVVASRDSTLMQMRSHPRIYEFLSTVLDGDVRDVYRELREGELQPDAQLLAYGCLFIAFDRFAQGRGPGLPSVNLSRISHVIMTGGAAQGLEPDVTMNLFALFNGNETVSPQIVVDSRYQLWVDGISWEHD